VYGEDCPGILGGMSKGMGTGPLESSQSICSKRGLTLASGQPQPSERDPERKKKKKFNSWMKKKQQNMKW